MKKLLMAVATLSLALISARTGNAASLCLGDQVTLAQAITDGPCVFAGYQFVFATPGVNNISTPGSTSTAIRNNTLVQLSSSGPMNLQIQYWANDVTKSWTAATNMVGSLNYHVYITPLNTYYGLVENTLTINNAKGTGIPVAAFKQVTQASNPLVNHQTNLSSGLAGAWEPTLSSSLSYSAMLGTIEIEDGLTLMNFGAANSRIGDATHPGSIINSLTFIQTPEPFTMLLSGAGLIGLGILRKRNRKA